MTGRRDHAATTTRMTSTQRREGLLTWLHAHGPHSVRSLFLSTPLELYATYWTLARDMDALRRSGSVRALSGWPRRYEAVA